MIVDSTIEPTELYLDKVVNGNARILARWDIQTIVRDAITFYRYQETVIGWKIPDAYLDTFAHVEQYITENAVEIMDFAKGSTKTLRRS